MSCAHTCTPSNRECRCDENMHDRPIDDPAELADLCRGDDDDEDQMADSYVLAGVDPATAKVCAALRNLSI